MAERIGRQTPTESFVLPYEKTDGADALGIIERVLREAYFMPGLTTIIDKEEKTQTDYTNRAPAPIFELDAAQMSGTGDAAIKINQAVPGYFDKNSLEQLTGVKAGEPGAEEGQQTQVTTGGQPMSSEGTEETSGAGDNS
jgi:hypothetical protein